LRRKRRTIGLFGLAARGEARHGERNHPTDVCGKREAVHQPADKS
jgi:hypothetical protein